VSVRLGDVGKGGHFRTRLTGRDGVVIGTDGIGIEVRWIEPDHDGTRRTQGVVDCPERWYRLHPQVEVDGEEGG
jgi:hypothetical protein